MRKQIMDLVAGSKNKATSNINGAPAQSINPTQPVMSTQLISVLEGAGLEPTSSNLILAKFGEFDRQATEWLEKAQTLVVEDETQTDKMKLAREARLALRKIRTDADKTRKDLKEDSLRYGKAVQGVYNFLEYRIKPIEDHLQAQEDFVKIKAQERIDALRTEREALVADLREFVGYGDDLGQMSQVAFDLLFNSATEQRQAQERERAEAEAQRQAQAELERLEQIRIREENERLRAENAAKEQALQRERELAQAEQRQLAEQLAAKEREERQRIEQEQADAAAKAKADAAAKAAPDLAKIEAYLTALESVAMPQVGADASEIMAEFVIDFNDLLESVRRRVKQN